MIRSIRESLIAFMSVVIAACIALGCESGGVGDPCVPEDEYKPDFQGFKISEANTESRSLQCETRICLVNHFQGRVSCPRGQKVPPAPCDRTKDKALRTDGAACVLSATFAPECKEDADCKTSKKCNLDGKFCECKTDDDCPKTIESDSKDKDATSTPQPISKCNPDTKRCESYVWHKPGNCQAAGGDNNKDKDCCVPGTDIPVQAPVCGQCGTGPSPSPRGTDAVYCSCRCGVAEGSQADPNFKFCDCPSGFECKEVRADIGLGDKQLTGKYCVKAGTTYDQTGEEAACGTVAGNAATDLHCSGLELSD